MLGDTLLINLVGIGPLFQNDAVIRRLASEAFKDLKDNLQDDKAAFNIYPIQFREIVLACGEILFGKESERRRAVRRARNLFESQSVRHVFPYDVERFRVYEKIIFGR